MEDVMIHRRSALLLLLILAIAVPTFAAPIPSKTADHQSLAARDADLAIVRDAAAEQQVAAVLAAHGLNASQVNARLASLSPHDLHQLAQNVNQIEAAGLSRQEWIWIGIGAVAALILIAVL